MYVYIHIYIYIYIYIYISIYIMHWRLKRELDSNIISTAYIMAPKN